MNALLFVKKWRSTLPPYPDRDPVPPSVPHLERRRLKTNFVEIKSQKVHSDCPYLIPTTQRTVHRTAKGGEQEAKEVSKYSYCCAIVFAPWNPGDDYGEPGDIWVNTGEEKAVWVVNGKGKCIRWPGNNSTEQVEHPWFPGLQMWYGGVNSWNWWDRDKNLRSTRSRQTHGQTAFAVWLKDKGRATLPGTGKVNLGSDVDAVEHWLETVGMERLPAVDGLLQATKNRKRGPDERSAKATESAPKRMKNDPAKATRPSHDVHGGTPGPSSRPGQRFAPSQEQLVIEATPSPKKHGVKGNPIEVGSSPGPPLFLLEKEKNLIVMSPGPDPEDINFQTCDDIKPAPGRGPSRGPSPTRPPQTRDGSASFIAESDRRASAYQLPPLDCCIGDRPGKEWPAGSEECTWPNGMRTVLPFVKSDRTTINLDSEAVKNMARSSAVPMNVEDNDSPVVLIELDDVEGKGIAGLTSDGKTASMEERRVLDRIEHAWSLGKAALLRGWTPGGPRIEFDEAGLTSLQANLDGKYQWQCARERDAARATGGRPLAEDDQGDSSDEEGPSTQGRVEIPARDGSPSRDIYKSTSLREFLKLAKEPDECGNILDSPAIDGAVPWFVSRLSDDQIAWRVTKDMGFSEAAKRVRKDATRANPSKGQKMNLRALENSDNLNKLTPATLKKTIGHNMDALGPQNLSADSLALRNWDLITMGGFYTFPHYDANGYGTWMNIRSGGKFWGFRIFKEDSLNTKEKIVRLYRKMSSGEEEIIGFRTNKGYCLFLHEKLTLLMPPGMVHEVYTSVNTIATGGHFLNYKFMHLTQWCRYVDRAIDSSLTNAEHTTIGRSLSRMVLAFTKFKKVIPKRSFFALAHMIMAPQLYESRRYREEAYAQFAWEDLEEWKEARRIIQEILIFKGKAIFGSKKAEMTKDLQKLTDKVGEMSLIAGAKWNQCDELDVLDLSYLVES